MKQSIKRRFIPIVLLVTLLLALCIGCDSADTPTIVLPPDYLDIDPAPADPVSPQTTHAQLVLDGTTDIPKYDGHAYVMLAESPSFSQEEKAAGSFESYSDLDSLGRCGTAFANVCEETMPTAPRESISSITPSGWANAKYDFVDGGYIYNRCHLIGFQLTAENANEKNLITGTRYLNIEGMLPFENMVADYVQETGNHVLYRVTPIFRDDDLVASGVKMEGWSIEDEGDGVCFDVYCYNVQPGAEIDYRTGETKAAAAPDNGEEAEDTETAYVLNTNTKKFHLPTCDSANEMSKKNREDFIGTRSELLLRGYEPCGRCKP